MWISYRFDDSHWETEFERWRDSFHMESEPEDDTDWYERNRAENRRKMAMGYRIMYSSYCSSCERSKERMPEHPEDDMPCVFCNQDSCERFG